MKTSATFWLTALIQFLTALVAIAIIIFMTIPKEGRREYRYVGAFLIFWLAVELASTIGYHFLHFVMNPVINLAELIFLLLIVMIYKDVIRIKHFATTSYIIGVHWTFALINFCFIQGPQKANSYTWALTNTIVVVICLYYFYFMIKRLPLQMRLTKTPMFWINMAIFNLYAGTFVVHLFEDYAVDILSSDGIVPYYFHVAFEIIAQPFFWYGLLMIRSEYRNRVITI